MTEDDIARENLAAYHLMVLMTNTINASGASPAVALLAAAKLLGQVVVMLDPRDPAELLECAHIVAQDEMRQRATFQALQAAGLGAIMPVKPA